MDKVLPQHDYDYRRMLLTSRMEPLPPLFLPGETLPPRVYGTLTPEQDELLRQAIERRVREIRFQRYRGQMNGEKRAEELGQFAQRPPEQKAALDEQIRIRRISRLASIERRLDTIRSCLYTDWFGRHAPGADRLAFLSEQEFFQTRRERGA
jgi:hypothetical protein